MRDHAGGRVAASQMLAAHLVRTDSAFALSLAVIVALVYLFLLRLVDLHEKEPLWALSLVLGLGAVAAAVLSAIVSARTLHGTVVRASVADAVTIFLALTVGVGLLEAVGKLRGWSEINGLVDGALYGAAAGLGFATGEAFIRELHGTNLGLSGLHASALDTLWPTLLFGLAAGLFGALMGAGFGAAVDRGGGLAWLLLPLLGLGVGFGVEVGYLHLAHHNGLGGSGGRAREWIALGVPGLFFVAVMLVGLRSERGAIASELADDPEAATPRELTLLRNHAARRAAYVARLGRLDTHGWLGLRSLQNRQVQLALTRRRAARIADPERRAEIEGEVQRLRAAVVAARRHLEAGSGGAAPAAQART